MMATRLDKKTRELLESKELMLDEFSVEVSLRESAFKDSDDLCFVFVNFYDNSETDEVIGSAEFFLFDATQTSVSDIRDNGDGYAFDLYQSVSSVRIYCDEFSAEIDKDSDFSEDENGDTTWLEIQEMARASGIHPFSYSEGFEQGTFEGLPYHIETTSVWGSILVMDEIKIEEEYCTNPIISTLFNTMLASFRKLGIDWIIVNTNVEEEYMKVNKYPFKSKLKYNTFLTKIGFKHSHGRLHNDEVCFCYSLKNS